MRSRTQTLVFVVAMSLHSVLEGLPLGGLPAARLYAFYLSILPHKVLESFALGTAVFQARFSRLFSLTLLLIFAALTPLGVCISLLLTHSHADVNGESKARLDAVLNGLTAGSFLYVLFVEMVPHALGHGALRGLGRGAVLARLVAMLAGFSLIAAAQLFHTH